MSSDLCSQKGTVLSRLTNFQSTALSMRACHGHKDVLFCVLYCLVVDFVLTALLFFYGFHIALVMEE